MLECEITANGLRTLTEKLGRERESLRDAEVEKFQEGELIPQYPQSPAVGAVMLDGGRAQSRASDSPRGVHEPAWVETKVANLSTYTDVSFAQDPQPDPPSKFLDPPAVLKIVREMKGAAGALKAKEVGKESKRQTSKRSSKKAPGPERKVRTVVATTKSCEEFGPMVAAEAMRRGFFQAKKNAVLGDGSLWIWGIAAFYLVGFEQILDFLHLLTHLYAATQAAFPGQGKKAWKLYEKLLRLAWAGKVEELKEVLAKHSQRIGLPPKGVADDDPRKILANALNYVDTNSERMDYARYRKAGLPISSAPVESLIKEVDKRVKGSEKFWIREGLEAILQVRAAYLSDDGREENFWACRPLGRAAGRSLFSRRRAA